MSQGRIRLDATLLPTGKVLATGGSIVDEDPNFASLPADLYDPATETWSPAGVAVFPRLYHSSALLLPDATVGVLGSNPEEGVYEDQIEIYSPAYLFTTDQNGNLIPATRPVITSAPPKIGYNARFTIRTTDAASVGQVVLMRPGSATHSFDFDQRLVELTFTTSGGKITATAPPTGAIAPPGYYMLFLINKSGVPSVAKFVHLSSTPKNRTPDATITLPTQDETIDLGASVNFAGSASDPDGSIASYKWIFPGGEPSTSTAQNPGLVKFSAPGTYIVSMNAMDTSGVTDPSPPTRTITVTGQEDLELYFVKPPPGATVSGPKITVILEAEHAQGYSNTFTLSVDGNLIGTTNVSGEVATFFWLTDSYAAGVHTLLGTVVDATGSTHSLSETVTLVK